MSAQRIAIIGGIGAGKSVVSRIVSAYGYPVYDCDSRAKRLMDNDSNMIARIAREVSQQAVNADGALNRRALADVVFSDADRLARLNAIVHGAVRLDLQRWFDRLSPQFGRVFVETAILTESGLDAMVDKVWLVDAPQQLRIERVMRRNAMCRADVERRVASQSVVAGVCPVDTIVNDDRQSLLLQIDALLA